MTASQKENDKKLKAKQYDLLGASFNSCRGQLMKLILFDLVKKTGQNFCCKCGAEIEDESELSVEHKIPWMSSDTPRESFFDLNNIAFSHLKCNTKTLAVCGTRSSYAKGCRCDGCMDAERDYKRKYLKTKNKNQ